MTKKEFLEAIKDVPEDTELLMAIWGLKGDGYIYFRIHPSFGKTEVRPIASGGNAAVISRADYCRADMMIEIDGSFHH